MRRFLTVNWHREFAVNFATFLKVCRDFCTFAPWFSYSPSPDQWATCPVCPWPPKLSGLGPQWSSWSHQRPPCSSSAPL